MDAGFSRLWIGEPRLRREINLPVVFQTHGGVAAGPEEAVACGSGVSGVVQVGVSGYLRDQHCFVGVEPSVCPYACISPGLAVIVALAGLAQRLGRPEEEGGFDAGHGLSRG